MASHSTSVAPLSSQRAAFDAQFGAILDDVHVLTTGLSDGQLNWQPEPGRWSIAEALDHLVVTDRIYLGLMETAIAEGRSKGRPGDGPFRTSFLGGMLIRSMEPPVRRKLPAPAKIAPRTTHTRERLLAEFEATNGALRRIIRESEGVDIGRVKVPSAIVRVMKLSVAEWFAFIAAHDRRHLWQARQVRNNPNFPVS